MSARPRGGFGGREGPRGGGSGMRGGARGGARGGMYILFTDIWIQIFLLAKTCSVFFLKDTDVKLGRISFSGLLSFQSNIHFASTFYLTEIDSCK